MFAVSDKLCHFLQFLYCRFIRCLKVICHHAGDQENFLFEVIKYDHLVKKHQVHIPEILLFFIFQFQFWLAVFNVIVGEISYQPACERRHIFHHRSFIFPDDFSECIARMCHLFHRFLCLSPRICFTDF